MTSMVHAAVAGDVAEAEEMQAILQAAGIEAQLQDGEDGSVTVVVPEGSLGAAQDALESLSEPDDLIAEP
jgi:type III secretory pathway lipoprotein EscJ